MLVDDAEAGGGGAGNNPLPMGPADDTDKSVSPSDSSRSVGTPPEQIDQEPSCQFVCEKHGDAKLSCWPFLGASGHKIREPNR